MNWCGQSFSTCAAPTTATATFDGSPAERTLLDLFPGGPIRIVFDAANLFAHETAARANALVDAATDLLGADIALAHAKDRDANGHVAAAGRGVIDWPRYLAALRNAGFDGTLIAHGLQAAEAAEVAGFLAGQLAAAEGRR